MNCGERCLPKRFTKHGGKKLKDIPVGALVPIRNMDGIWKSTRDLIDEWLGFLMRNPDQVESPLWVKPDDVAHGFKVTDVGKRKIFGELTDKEVEWLVTDFEWDEKQKTYQYFAGLEYDRREKRGVYHSATEVDLKPLFRAAGARYWSGEVGYQGRPGGWYVSNPCKLDELLGVMLTEQLPRYKPKEEKGWPFWITIEEKKVVQPEPRKAKAKQQRSRVYGFKRRLTKEEKVADKIIEVWDEIWTATLDQLREINDKISWLVAHGFLKDVVEFMMRNDLERRMDEVLNEQPWEWVKE